jgi:hypothetical protein
MSMPAATPAVLTMARGVVFLQGDFAFAARTSSLIRDCAPVLQRSDPVKHSFSLIVRTETVSEST